MVYHIHLPVYDNIVLGVINFLFYPFISSSWNRIGYAFRINLSNSQENYFKLRCLHCILTYPTVRFKSKNTLLSRIHSGPTWNSPSGSTFIKLQSITWVASWICFFKMETWKMSCNLIVGIRSKWYATDPTLAKISNRPQYLGVKY